MSAETRPPSEALHQVDVEEFYAQSESLWPRRIHEVLQYWCEIGNQPGNVCVYRYKGMKTTLERRGHNKIIKADTVRKHLKALECAGIISRPPVDEMKWGPRRGKGYPIKVLVPPPNYEDRLREKGSRFLQELDERDALAVIGEYLEDRGLYVGGWRLEPDVPFGPNQILTGPRPG